MSSNKDFIVISDFHSMLEPFYKLKYYYTFEYNDIFILGDVTDRGEKNDGTGGLNILIDIMKLEKDINSLPDEIRKKHHIGRIHYIPGNHDDFLYEYALLQDKNAKENMELNHGNQTIKDIDDIRKKNPKLLEELTEWLGSKPLQVKHTGRDGKVYCLAHAFFDEFLYNQNKDYSLSYYLYAKKLYRGLFNVFWFRKGQDAYQSFRVPSSDNIGVIGHTPSMLNPNTRNFDLEGSDGKTFRVMNVDGGLAYGGDMLEYSGGDSIIKAATFDHNDIENIKNKKYPYYDIDDIFKRYLNTNEEKKEKTQHKINSAEYKKILRKLWNSCYLLLSENTNVFGDNLLDMLYQMVMNDNEYKKLNISYPMFCEIIIYNHVFQILSDMYNNISNEEKVLKDFNNWIRTSHMNYGYSEKLYILTSKISVDTIIEYINGTNDLKNIFNYTKKYASKYSQSYSMNHTNSLPILLPKKFIESFNNNGDNIRSYKKS